tara:strand:+ start:280 stop:1305 length:1026 start_codon:yes stop_codon:yes gene_type:complete
MGSNTGKSRKKNALANPFSGKHHVFNHLLNTELWRPKARGRNKVLDFFEDIFQKMSRQKLVNATYNDYINLFLHMSHDIDEAKHPYQVDSISLTKVKAVKDKTGENYITYDMTYDRLQAGFILHMLVEKLPEEIKLDLYSPVMIQGNKSRSYILAFCATHSNHLQILEQSIQEFTFDKINDSFDVKKLGLDKLINFFDCSGLEELRKIFSSELCKNAIDENYLMISDLSKIKISDNLFFNMHENTFKKTLLSYAESSQPAATSCVLTLKSFMPFSLNEFFDKFKNAIKEKLESLSKFVLDLGEKCISSGKKEIISELLNVAHQNNSDELKKTKINTNIKTK